MGQGIDIEGLDFEGGYLWLVGPHSVKRKKASAGKDRGYVERGRG